MTHYEAVVLDMVLYSVVQPSSVTGLQEMIQAKQDTHGRTHAAWLMLRRLSRRGNWVPGLQLGLCSSQVRLEHLAQKIEDLLCEFAVLIGETLKAVICV